MYIDWREINISLDAYVRDNFSNCIGKCIGLYGILLNDTIVFHRGHTTQKTNKTVQVKRKQTLNGIITGIIQV